MNIHHCFRVSMVHPVRYVAQFLTSSLLMLPVFLTLTTTVPTTAQAFEPPKKSGSPKGTSGGGTRPAGPNRCVGNPETPLQTLTPPTGVGFTETQRPQFWVHLPPHQASLLEFTLQANNSLDTAAYQVTIPAPQLSGWTALALSDVPALQSKQLYRWSVALVCNPNDRPSSDVVVRGNLVYQPQGKRSDPLQKIRSDYWLDAMSKLNEQYRGDLSPVKSKDVILENSPKLTIANDFWKAMLLKSQGKL